MRAIVYDEFGGPLAVRDVPDPVAAAGGAVIRVAASGLCRSDWHAWAGHDDTVHLPHVPGHEFVGTIESLGAGVHGWTVGDRVTAPFVCGCGTCEWCLQGDAQVCPNQTQPGFTDWGSHAERVVIRAADVNFVAVPADIPDEAAASLGCRFATAFRAVRARAAVRAGEWVAIFGAGGVGLSAVMIAAAVGARVIAVDPNPDALALATRVGALQGLAASPSVPASISDITGGGAHVAVDAVGSASTSAAAINSLRRRGRYVQIGLLSVDQHPRVPWDRVIGWELDILGSHGMAARDYADMLVLVKGGSLRPQELVGRIVTLEKGAELLPQSATAASTGMTVVRPG
ncbi:alcohol dehydrogenase catalytic domain-containing protein [Nakamurella sp. GG22]